MSLGLLLLGHHALNDLVDQAKVAEACGYEEVWLADERFYREVYSCLTHFAASTSRVRLGPCVTDPYARHPALTASAIATLDEISGQRAMLAIGAGISGFAELGIVRNKPAKAIREAVQVIRPLLRGETVDFHGEVVNFNEGKLSFTPVREHSDLRGKQRPAWPSGGGRGCGWRHHGGLRFCGRGSRVSCRRRSRSHQGWPRSQGNQTHCTTEHVYRHGWPVGARCCASDGCSLAGSRSAQARHARGSRADASARGGCVGCWRCVLGRLYTLPSSSSARH